jgi:hypothetical protein
MSLSPYNSDLLFRQPIQPVHHRIDQLIRLPDPLPQRHQFAHRSFELGLQRFAWLPADRIDGQRFPVLLQHRQKAFVIVIIALRATVLGVRSSTLALTNPSSQPRKPLTSVCFCLFISSILSARKARKAGRSCTTSDRSWNAMKLPASSLGRQTRMEMLLISSLGDLEWVPFARLSAACFLVRCCARVLRAGRAGALSTPGGLGYLAAEWLMDLNNVCTSSFLGFVLRGLFFFVGLQ